jgi:hypothetical protein
LDYSVGHDRGLDYSVGHDRGSSSTVVYGALLHGAINVASDSFGVMLVSENYRPDLTRHTRRSDITDEIVGAGYNGPVKVEVKMTYTDNGGIHLQLGGARWPKCDIRPRAAIYFKANGEEAFQGPLIAAHDFGKVFQCTDGAFILEPTVLEFN